MNNDEDASFKKIFPSSLTDEGIEHSKKVDEVQRKRDLSLWTSPCECQGLRASRSLESASVGLRVL